MPRINYAYVSSQWANLLYSPVTDLIAAHHLLNAELSYKLDRFKFTLYGTNLTKEYNVSGQSGNNEFFGAPREYGIRITGKF